MHPLLIIGLLFLATLAALIVASVIRTTKWKNAIKAHESEWGTDICNQLLDKTIDVGMTWQMVALGWGKPNITRKMERTETRRKVRWVYGRPRVNARYVWFTNGKVTKIEGGTKASWQSADRPLRRQL